VQWDSVGITRSIIAIPCYSKVEQTYRCVIVRISAKDGEAMTLGEGNLDGTDLYNINVPWQCNVDCCDLPRI